MKSTMLIPGLESVSMAIRVECRKGTNLFRSLNVNGLIAVQYFRL